MTESTRQERRKQRTTEAILDAAERLFSLHGYPGTSIEAICAEADVAIGSVYARFAGKQDLYLGLVERFLFLNERYIADALNSESNPLDQVVAVGQAYLRFHQDNPIAFRFLGLRDLPSTPDGTRVEARARIQKRLLEMLDQLIAAIDAAMTAGDIQPVDPKATATFLWGAWNGAIALHLQGTISQRHLAATFASGTDLITRALVNPAEQTHRPAVHPA